MEITQEKLVKLAVEKGMKMAKEAVADRRAELVTAKEKAQLALDKATQELSALDAILIGAIKAASRELEIPLDEPAAKKVRAAKGTGKTPTAAEKAAWEAPVLNAVPKGKDNRLKKNDIAKNVSEAGSKDIGSILTKLAKDGKIEREGDKRSMVYWKK